MKLLLGIMTSLGAFFRSRHNLCLEILALRQQLGVFHRKHPRPHLRARDRLFGILIHCLSPSDQARRLWATFLRNHREVIAAMDCFAVPTATFRVLYCFFVIEHGRCSGEISYYPLYYPLIRVLPLFTPFSSRTTSQAFNAALFPEVAKSPANHVAAHAGTCALNLAERE